MRFAILGAMPRQKIPWPPVIPVRLANVLAPFTPYEGGWCRWHNGRSIHVCGRGAPLDEIEGRWQEKCRQLDRKAAGAIETEKSGDITVRLAAAAFYEWLDRRVKTRKPAPLTERTGADYKREVNAFGRFVGPDRPLKEITQPDFTGYALTFGENAPSTFHRVVAYLQAFFTFCADEGLIDSAPQYGRSFVKPPRQEHRDKRMAETKSYTVDELRQLWHHARGEERLWLALGLNGAMDNSDLAHLTVDVIDRIAGLFDYRRRKRGKVRRVIPIRPEVLFLLDQYVRRAPAGDEHADRLLLTPTGLPLQRMKESAAGRSNPLDYVSMRWTRLLIRAGLRAPMPAKRRVGRKNLPDDPERPKRFKAKGGAAGQGFRALRTTFANLAPPGYRDEVEIVMGHNRGGVLLDSYLERFGVARLRELVDHVWQTVFPWPIVTLPPRPGESFATESEWGAGGSD